MKPLRLLLILSLLGNVWLAASVITGPRARIRPEPPAASLVIAPAATTPLDSPSPPPERTLRETAQDLRAAGLSPGLVERILVQMLDESEPVDTRAHWRPSPVLSPNDRLQRETEREQALLDALGDEYRFGAKRIASLRKNYGNYSPELLDRIDTLLRDYKEIDAQAREEPSDAGVRVEMKTLLTSEQETDLLELLGSDGFFDYQVRNSDTARSLRNSLDALSPTETEFREIFRLYAAANGNAQSRIQFTKALPTFMADPANQSALVATLGNQRALELELATDPKLFAESRFLRVFDFPSSTLAALQGLRARQESALAALAPTDTGTSSPEQLETARLALTQVSADLDTLLTPEIAARYRGTHGEWLKLPEPAETPPPSN